jgi:ATP-dependent Clp protease adaptor protein ClpS
LIGDGDIEQMSADNNKPNNSEGDLALDKRTKTKKPSLYRVIMLNDDYTPMEFVVLILQRFFGHNTQSAQKIMLHVHQKGVGVCGIYTYEVAEAKINQVMTFARQNEHPLQLQMEKE